MGYNSKNQPGTSDSEDNERARVARDLAAQQQADASNEQDARNAAKMTPAEKQAALAAAAARAEEHPRDETQPGGHYIVNGQHVNAHGKPLHGKHEHEQPANDEISFE